jgi:hypothetical protein
MSLTRVAAIVTACLATAVAGAQTTTQRRGIDWSGVPGEARAQIDGNFQPNSQRRGKGPAKNVEQRKVPPRAGKREVIFIFNWSDAHWVAGNVVPLKYVSAILFLKEPCPLDIVGTEQMRRAWHFADVGCWATTADDGYAFASSVTGDIRDIPGPMEYMIHGEVQPDNGVLITEQGFDSLTFERIAAERVSQRVLRRVEKMRDARP